ncbi:hypothetical protein DFJ73DRAFT_838102 [Zopfochytrium polystomum]|nr:hypothetical protein DFJ73DRAFT_838102 [Zopfochytrium polystomum]
MLQIQALIPGNVNANFANVMQAGGALQAQYMKMVQSVAAALLNETGVMGFEIMNEPFLLLPGFNEAGAKALAAAGWVDPIVVVEAPFANVTKVRPAGIKNIVYGPHHYNWRFILDPLETQLRYWLQEGGLINPVKAFADAPSEKTMNDMMHHFTFFHNATSVLALNLAAQSADNAVVANFMDNAAKMSDYSAQVQSHGNAILNSPGSLLAAIEKGVLVAIVTLVVELFNGICFTPAIGLFSLLRAILPLLPPDTDAAVATMVSDAKSAYGGAPVLVGEFGCNAGAAYLHCDTWTHSLASSADAAKATGWIQWAYVPQWSDALKDVFNLEDLSVTTGVSGGYAKRQTFIQGRPLVRALAGSLTALTTAVGKGTVQYVTAGAVGAVSEIFFDEAVACGTGKTAAIAVQGSASCAYATGGRSLVLCSSTAANVNVTVTLSC